MPSDSDFKQNNIDNLEEVRSDLSSYGFNRSVQNIYSLYLKVSLANENKNLLNVKPDCSSKDLAMIMNEYYESDGQKREKHQGFAGLGKREPAHVVTKLESTFDRSWKTHIPRQMDNGSPQRSKEDYADINSLKRLKVDTRAPPKFKKQRKPRNPQGKALVNIQFESDMQLFQRLELLASKIGSFKRKQPGLLLMNNAVENDGIYRPFLRYIIDEYFYSDIDKGFFEYNLLKTILNRIGLNEDDRGMTVKEWNSVRRMAGKPRRFSQVLVNQELEQLNTFRERARVWVNKKQLINDGLFPKELTLAIQNLIPMQVGQTVLAVHPGSSLLHRGKILTIDDNNIMVNFLTNELGVSKVPDFNLMLIGDRENYADGAGANHSDMFDFESEQNMQILRDLDFFAMALMIKILERKTFLVNELRHFNDLAEKKQTTNLKEEFFEDMGFIGNQINSLDKILQHITTKFRIRGIGGQNPDKLGRNFENVFNIFKKNIEREIEVCRDPEQREDLIDVVNFLNQTLDDKIVKEVMGEMRQLFPKDKLDLLEDNFEQSASERQSTREHDREITSSSSTIEVQSLGRQFKIKAGMSKDEQAKLMQFVLDCGGILKTLSTTHDINMKNNVFLRDLFSLTFDHKKECHDISNALVSLSSKIKAIH